MTKTEAINAVNEAFSNIKRPSVFVRDTCCCDECKEHNETLSAYTPDTISIEQLGNPGWDPICFSNNQAFLYYLPAMIRLAFDKDYYVDQLISHLDSEGRLDALNESQKAAIYYSLQTLMEVDHERIQDNLDKADMKAILKKLEQQIT